MSSLITESLPSAVESNILALVHIKYSFIVGVVVFVICLPFCRSKKSFFDAIAARKVTYFIRAFIFLELLSISTLYYFCVEYGQPIPVNLSSPLTYSNGNDWLYGYGRPTAALVLIGVGLAGDMHPAPRIICMLGAALEIVCDAFSAYQVRYYYQQVLNYSAPSLGYSENTLLAYYWRDIISLGSCTTILFFAGLLNVIVGWCDPQLIHPSLISGSELDRFATMHVLRDKRKSMQLQGLLEL